MLGATSVRLSVSRVSHTQKRFRLGLCNYHRTVAPITLVFCIISFLHYKFHQEILTGSLERRRQTNKSISRQEAKLSLG